MPLPMINVVQHQLTSDPKRRVSMHASAFSFDDTDSPDVYSTSLFDRLPVELQIEIFTQCLPLSPHFDAREAPLLISRVSQPWRALVFSVPKLWSSFEIEVSESDSSNPLYESHIEESTKLWLARSKNYPLTVSLIHIPVGRIPNGQSKRLLALLIPEAYRWKSVQITLPTANMIPLPSHFPLLQSLALQLKGLWKLTPAVDISTSNIPWYQLSRLNLQLEQNNLPTLGDMLFIFAQTSKLRQCKISVDCTLDSGVDFDLLHLPVLEEFHLIVQGGLTSTSPALSLSNFFHHISVPALRELNITWLVQRSTLWPNFQLFISFLRRISSTLNTLSLAYLPVSETDLIQILTPFSNVTHLRLHFPLSDHEHDPVSDNLLSLLTIRSHLTRDDDDSLLPSLVSLDLHCNGSNFSNLTLLAMIKSRWHDSGICLGHFGLLSMKPGLREVQNQVQWINREGVDISVETLIVR